jgi:hypothetical protein
MTSFYKIVSTIRNEGLKAAWTKHRWKLLLVIFCYYLFRDVMLYIVMPFLIYRIAF